MSKLVNADSIPVLLKEMSVKEKIDLLVGKSAFSTLEMPKYGIPSIRYLDGATGVNMLQYIMELMGAVMTGEKENKQEEESEESSNESGAGAVDFVKYATTDIPLPETLSPKVKGMLKKMRALIKELRPEGEEPGCFPPGMLLGATWNPKTVYQVGEAVAREAMAYDIDVLLGTPNTNIQRDPKNGRVFESFSEDPCLSSSLAPAFSKAVQDQGMVADVKHFAANNQETLRQGINESISERALREIYLPGFEAAVKEGGAGTVMSAYNSINGVPCAQNEWLLTEVLKKEWGFDGQVVSDWGAVYDQPVALRAGNDLDMPGPRGKQKLYQAVEEGTVSMERVDDAVRRLLGVILNTPEFKGKKYTKIDNELSKAAAYQAAAEGITLLKNDNLLPLKEGTKVSLYGRLTERFMESGSGSAQVDTSKFTSLPEELGRYTAEVRKDEIKSDTDVVVITAGASGQEGKDRPDMDFDPEDKEMLRDKVALAKQKGKKVVLILNVAGPVELKEYMESIDALVCIYFPGMEGARALADILFGKISPCGKLPITFPVTYRQTPTAINFPGEFGKVNYGEGIFVGYRYYDYKGLDPLYPFGFGLSYSMFSIKDARISQSEYDNRSEEPLYISVTVKNEGNMEAKEVVQMYVHSRQPKLLKPEKELKGFQKVNLLPGEEQTVRLKLQPKDFASYDEEMQEWTVETGVYDILLGNSSRDISTSATVRITGRDPYGCSLHSPISDILRSESAIHACEDVFGEKFEVSALKNNTIYFGATPLKVYLEKNIRGIDKTTNQWKNLLDSLEQRLEEI